MAKLDINIELDLSYLSTQLRNSSYEPERYPSLIFRPESLPTVLVTRSGVLLFTGGDSAESIHRSHNAIAKELKKIGLECTGNKENIQIQNIVVTLELKNNIHLNHLSIKLGLENIEYEPEQFPGMIYRMEDGPVAIIFSSGKIVLTGASSTEEILSAVEMIRERVQN